MNIKRIQLIVLILLLLKSLIYAQMTTSEITNKYSQSVVTIIALDENNQPLSLGSGFFINSEGDVATNHHVLEGSANAIIKTLKGETGNIIEIIKDDPDLDLLIAKTSLRKSIPVPLGNSDAISVGDDIVAIGNPAGLEGTVSKGIISGIREVEGIKFIQITAPISPGSSGGPVFNLLGKVIGIATAYLDLGQNLNFAMPINYLGSLKQTSIKLSLLPKMKTKLKTKGEDETLVQIFDVHYNHCNDGTHLCSIDYAIKNLNNYPIKNIKLLFVYQNYKGETVSYDANIVNNVIQPQLALQFTNHFKVGYFYNYSLTDIIVEGLGGEKKPKLSGKVEVRILDYEIDRSSRN